MLIDVFINAIFLYDDKMVITFNYKEGTETIAFDTLKEALSEQASGSDLDCLAAPYHHPNRSFQWAKGSDDSFLRLLQH